MINSSLLLESLPQLLHGLWISLQIALFSSTIGILFGIFFGFVLAYKIPFLKLLVTVYVNIIRGTPMLIQILFAFYFLPQLGFSIDAFWTAVIAIGLNSSAYISQIMRSGIQAIPQGQLEAAQVLGLSKIDTIRFIILPQALAIVLPSLGNEFVTLVKDSSLASIIGVTELAKEGRIIISQKFDAITIFVAMALLYLSVTLTISGAMHLFEKRMRKHA